MAQTNYLRQIQTMISNTVPAVVTDTCPICYEDFTDADDTLKTSLDCSHTYHIDCFLKHAQMLIKDQKTVFCPMCRKEFPYCAPVVNALPSFHPQLVRTVRVPGTRIPITRIAVTRMVHPPMAPTRTRNLGFNGSAFTIPNSSQPSAQAYRRSSSVRFV